jgi:hypothetical protein
MTTDLFVLTQASALHSKIGQSSYFLKSLKESASIHTLFQIATELRLCQTWISEIEQIENKIAEIVKRDYLNIFTDQVQYADEVKKFESKLDRLIDLGRNLDNRIGLTTLSESIDTIWALNRNIQREVDSALEDLNKENT